MLPDFPKSRREMSEQLRLHLRLRVQSKSLFADIPRQTQQHEGERFIYEQMIGDEKRVVDEGFEVMQIPVRFSAEEISKLTGDALVAKLEELADAIAEETSKHGFRKMEEACRVGGTAHNAGGQPLSQELFLQMEESRDWEFDPVTHKVLGVYVAHPETAKRMDALWKEWEKDRAFMKKVAEQKTRKFEAWRDRESRRKLVD